MARNKFAASSDPAGSSWFAPDSGRSATTHHLPRTRRRSSPTATPMRGTGGRPYKRRRHPDSLPVPPDNHAPYHVRHSPP
ncbi:hypothetical protein AB0L68_16625 [Streptomyces sp. NPDC052164]|uniref:hypothetical protein n=1 Tax=Streptomyces sp. NPDC052164 TaxID=3155529 RepID=UPI00343AED6E